MGTDAVIYLEDGIGDEALRVLDEYAPEVILKNLSGLGEIASVHAAVPAAYSGRLKDFTSVYVREEQNDSAFWKRFFAKSGCDHVVKLPADAPFLDMEIIGEMLELHKRYKAEFTYSENLPSGFAAEILSRELIQAVPETNESMRPLAEVVRANLNQFDVELYYREPDIRDKRLSFRSGNPRERRIMENIRSTLGRVPRYGEMRDFINEHPEVLFIGPSYVEIELTGRCDLDCIFCFRKRLGAVHQDMETASYKKILGDLREFDLPYAVCLGGSGEPMMHKDFYAILEHSLSESQLTQLVVETNGIYADDNFSGFLSSARDERLRIIVNINGFDRASYSGIHRGDYFDAVCRNILSIKERVTKSECLYIQIMKIRETEPFLDRYYDFWEKHGVPIILQKQNTYLGLIEDRRYSDLSPLERTPCWHLQRDLSILSDGRLAFCKQDVDGACACGACTSDSLKSLWRNSQERFIHDYRGRYPQKPDCSSCDEWYTFNL